MTTLALVATDTYRAIAAAVHDAIRDRSVAAILGPAGTGKSEAIDQNVPEDTAYLGVPTNRGREQAIRTLLEGLTNASQPSGLSRHLLATAREELRYRQPLLIVDPVVDAHEHLLALLAELWEAGDLPGLVLAGGDESDRVLHGAPGLHFAAVVTHTAAMTPGEVLECVPLLHPLLQDADPDLLLQLDAHYAYGYIARWQRLTTIAEHAADGATTLNHELADITVAIALRRPT